MKKSIGIFACALLMLQAAAVTGFAEEEDVIKVACVGDSITEGFMSSNTATCSYPAQLQTFLDMDRYEVRNFGIGGRTAMKNPDEGMYTYWNESLYTQSKEFLPDVVIIMLGTNDVVTTNWNGGETYLPDLKALVESYQQLSSQPQVYLATPPQAFDTAHPDQLNNVAVPIVKQVAEETGATLVDINAMTVGMSEYFPDTIHPNDAGYLKLAQMFYESVFGGKAAELTVVTEPGNKVSMAGQVVTADSEGKATLVTGDGNKSVKIEKAGVGFSYVEFEVKGNTTADCSAMTIAENMSLSATFKDPSGNVTKASDGDMSTGWQRDARSSYQDAWLMCDFGESRECNTATFDWEGTTRPAANGYKLQYSSDGTIWTEVPGVAYDCGEAADTVTFDTVNTRYLRIKVDSGIHSKFFPQIYEWGIFNKSGESFVPTVTYEGENAEPTESVVSGTGQSEEGSGNVILYVAVSAAVVIVAGVAAALTVKAKKNNGDKKNTIS